MMMIEMQILVVIAGFGLNLYFLKLFAFFDMTIWIFFLLFLTIFWLVFNNILALSRFSRLLRFVLQISYAVATVCFWSTV
jgi:hypothetical protein